MRNNSGELLRRVAEGESVLITNGGVPAAVMLPAGSDTRTRLIAAGRLVPVAPPPGPPLADRRVPGPFIAAGLR